MPEDRVTFRILSDGEAISTEIQVISVVISREVNRIPVAKLIVLDGDPSQSDFPRSNGAEFEPGKEIEITAGRGEETTLFKGVIVKHRIKVKDGGQSRLFIEARDAAFKTTLNPMDRLFLEAKDSEAVEEILGDMGLEADVAATEETHQFLVQHNVTDWDFILKRARLNAQLVIVANGKVSTVAPELAGSPAVVLTYGADVLGLDLEMDARTQVAGVQTRTWDPANQEIVTTDAEEPAAIEQGNMDGAQLADAAGLEAPIHSSPGHAVEGVIQGWANGELLHSRLSRICGSIACQGTADAAPGNVLELKGCGERFSGNAFITGVQHEFYTGDWRTAIQVGLPRELFAAATDDDCFTDLSHAIGGLHVGKVLQLEGDPDDAERILVHLPLIHPEGEDGVWARLATLDAGAGRGMVFRPEIDDEVIVGFLGGDPDHPVVLGQLHSAANPAPVEAADDNHEKGYVSREGIKLIFNDESGNESVTLETPGGHKLFMDDGDKQIIVEDSNGNKMTMNGDGIKIETPGDLVITTDGDTKVDAAGSVELNAGADVKATAGANATLDAGAEAKVTGSAGAEVSSGGQLKLAGALVAIN